MTLNRRNLLPTATATTEHGAAAARKIFALTCVRCGATFEGLTPKARYCGQQCKDEQAKVRGTKNETSTVCAVCGDVLDVDRMHRAARYCGQRCKKTAAMRRYRQKQRQKAVV